MGFLIHSLRDELPPGPGGRGPGIGRVRAEAGQSACPGVGFQFEMDSYPEVDLMIIVLEYGTSDDPAVSAGEIARLWCGRL
jgi:hypothetical protein